MIRARVARDALHVLSVRRHMDVEVAITIGELVFKVSTFEIRAAARRIVAPQAHCSSGKRNPFGHGVHAFRVFPEYRLPFKAAVF